MFLINVSKISKYYSNRSPSLLNPVSSGFDSAQPEETTSPWAESKGVFAHSNEVANYYILDIIQKVKGAE